MSSTTITPTAEQQKALALFGTGKSLVIEAGAGAGKTSTLRLLAESTTRRGQYVAFNRAIVEESKAKMPRNVACSTAHSLAYRAVVPGTRYAARLKNSARMKSTDLAKHLGIREPIHLTLPDGTHKRLGPAFLAGLTMRGVIGFCQSADLQPEARHVPYIDGIDLPPGSYVNNNEVARTHVPYMRKAWADIVNERGILPFRHDHYLKMWHLSSPRIDTEFILFDEAQDANPVLVAIIEAQTHAQIVWVGDSQQQIYTFTGAVNALQKVQAEQKAYLSQSFRFGPAVAEKANHCLRLLDAELTLTGTESIPSTVGALAEPDAYLCRTNATTITILLDELKRGRRPHLVGGGREVADFAKAANDLMTQGWTSHPELACFKSWGEVQEYVEQDEQGGDLRLMVNLIDEFGVQTILDALERMPREEDADIVISTAHKAKGREWDSVKIADDFPDEPSGEELRLMYVAVTRARLALDLTAASEFFGLQAGVLVATDGMGTTFEVEADAATIEIAQRGTADHVSIDGNAASPRTPQATVAEDVAGRPGVFNLHADNILLGVHTDSKVAIETAWAVYRRSSFQRVVVVTEEGELVMEYVR
jgi:hypothetical protein